jgi:carbamoyltransferase
MSNQRRPVLAAGWWWIIVVVQQPLLVAQAWTHAHIGERKSRVLTGRFFSTPFEANLYDVPNEPSSSSVVTRHTPLVVGINKYTHDTSICIANQETGRVEWALSKERLSRRKHDAGPVADLIQAFYEQVVENTDERFHDDGVFLNITRIVVNNHHHRVAPLERNPQHMAWEAGLGINGGAQAGYTSWANILDTAEQQHELSHHLAHAYATAAQAPFDHGLVVVMDGMGETYRTMRAAQNDVTYTSDFDFASSWDSVPADLADLAAESVFDWREAESVYLFSKEAASDDDPARFHLRPVWKRFTPERTPPTLFNHGFENMDSVGAVYSRASSHIFGDWNACGKVMGLAPWANGKPIRPVPCADPILSGTLYYPDANVSPKGDPLRINRTLLEGLPCIARTDADLFLPDGNKRKLYDFDDESPDAATGTQSTESAVHTPTLVALDAISIAHRVQSDVEQVVLDAVKHFKLQTGSTNLCFAGGVALNSVLNGRLARELGFNETFISPYPGDDGIAVGCCAYGLFGNVELEKLGKGLARLPLPVWGKPLSPYLGPEPTESDLLDALQDAEPWLTVEKISDEERRLSIMAKEVASGGVIAWYRSRSEMGPRALGHRSILADPRKKGLVRFINEKVKRRESFRPFAPSVLAEEAGAWFDLGAVPSANVSPYMSLTAQVLPDKRAEIPAVTHVDGSSRLQTVTMQDEPIYHKFISKFFEMTGVPMVLNTSFNALPSEPIVESPRDAIRSFLFSMGSIEFLVLGDNIVRRKLPEVRLLLGEASKSGEIRKEAVCPQRAGPATFESSFSVPDGPVDEDEAMGTVRTRVRMPQRVLHCDEKNEWYECLDEMEGELLSVCDGTVSLNDIMAQYTTTPSEEQFEQEDIDDAEVLLQNIVHRLVRLFENTLISW